MEERLDDPTFQLFQLWTLPRSRALIWPGDGLYSMIPRLHLLEIAWGLILFPMCRRFWNRSGGYVPCIFGIILWGKKSRSTYSIIQLWKCVLSLFGSSFWVRGWFLCFRYPGIELQLNNISPTKRAVKRRRSCRWNGTLNMKHSTVNIF